MGEISISGFEESRLYFFYFLINVKKEPKYIVYFTYLNSKIFLSIIRWSDRALLELSICSVIRKRLTKNFICGLEDCLSPAYGFINPVDICWEATYPEDTAFDWYMSTDLGNLKVVLEELDPGKLINLYYVY